MLSFLSDDCTFLTSYRQERPLFSYLISSIQKTPANIGLCSSSGIGFAIAQQLLRKGATVYLGARSESKAVATIARLEREGLEPGNGKPKFHELKLDHPKDAKVSAEEFMGKEERLDILSARSSGFVLARTDHMTTVNNASLFVHLASCSMKKSYTDVKLQLLG